AGTYAADYWFFTATANYNNIGNTTITDKINKANASVVVTPYDVTYDGHAHTAAITSITGVNGETGATVGAVDVSNTSHTNAGMYASDYWFFTATANYNNIGNTTITDKINKTDATVVVTPYNVTYDGHEHMATITSITGVNTAAACIVSTPYSVTYDDTASPPAAPPITGVNGETGATVGVVDVSHTSHTPAGTYSNDTWSFTGGANYNDIAATTITDHIAKANATFTVMPYDVTYDGSEHTASVSAITGVNGETGATVGIVNLGNTKH